MLLAGDVGGTKTLLGLFEPAVPRPRPIAIHAYPTNTFESFTQILDAFARDVNRPFSVDAAVAGVAGPVVEDTARLTNVAWDVSASEMTSRFGTSRVALLNDLEAMAASADVLTTDELVVLQAGTPRPDGNAVVIAAGTGLGEAFLVRVNGRLRPVPSEGGHADFAARTDREIDFLRMLRDLYGRAEVEHVLSGPGLLNLHRFTHQGRDCAAVRGLDEVGAPAGITQAALAGTCEHCRETLAMFVNAYGAEAGNLALQGVATAGVFVGGGIAPKILPAMTTGVFMRAFAEKPPLDTILNTIPVKVILNPHAGLIGAATRAASV